MPDGSGKGPGYDEGPRPAPMKEQDGGASVLADAWYW